MATSVRRREKTAGALATRQNPAWFGQGRTATTFAVWGRDRNRGSFEASCMEHLEMVGNRQREASRSQPEGLGAKEVGFPLSPGRLLTEEGLGGLKDASPCQPHTIS